MKIEEVTERVWDYCAMIEDKVWRLRERLEAEDNAENDNT